MSIILAGINTVTILAIDKRLAEHENRLIERLNGRYVLNVVYQEHAQLVERRLEKLEG